MVLVDDVKILAIAGDGGNGGTSRITVTMNDKIYQDGGNGGRGGNIFFQATHNISDLSQFRFQKEIKAESGVNGGKKNKTGRNGEDTITHVPPGTRVIDLNAHSSIEILDTNIPVLISRGGIGGIGSHDYKPDVNNPSIESNEGTPGEKKELHLILNIIADIGLIGFPNAGKSSILDALTNANPSIGNYLFTTVSPNIGVMGKIVIADIPGLIEGASEGKGLGITFLKHIEKTKILIHCIDIQSVDPIKDYRTIRSEFEKYNKSLLEKEEIILLTKIDLVDEKVIEKQTNLLKQLDRKILPVSIYNEESMSDLRKILKKVVEI